jgi:hypothetical protein
MACAVFVGVGVSLAFDLGKLAETLAAFSKPIPRWLQSGVAVHPAGWRFMGAISSAGEWCLSPWCCARSRYGR